MKVYIERKKYSDHRTPTHLVEKFTWMQGGYQKMITPKVHTWCGIDIEVRKGDTYEEYVKDIHKKQTCEECRKVINLYVRRQKAFASSLKTESEHNLGEKSSIAGGSSV